MTCWQNGGRMSLNRPGPACSLYIGIAFYKVGEPSKIEPDWMINGGVPELKKQLDLNDAVPEISGTILFREDYLNKPQTQQAVSYLQSRWGS